ncbi:hypothetical protein PVT01_000078900 [Plasmodium vivax]|uniref:VIR protein n=1 Tax=Plasmodium vivax TaxID=5855 RepID=A0A1G4EAF6_PLAVI|nr:hypothetical protein PVT01_000078900 [Plasmodium vivax]
MLYGRNRPRNNVSDIIRGYQERRCLNQYSKIKGEIEHQIAELTKNYNSLFCKKCGAIKKDIFKKKTELNFCYNNNYLKPKLLEDIVINDFIKNCADPPHCRNPTAVPKRTVALEKSKDVPCKKGITGCNKSTAQPKTEEGKSKPRADAETSEIIGLKGPASVKQGQEHHHVGKSRSEISQDKPGTTAPHSPVGTHDEAPQQLDNKHNTPSGEGATQLEGLSHEPPSTDSKLGEPSSDSSHQHNSQRVSDVNCTPQGTISDQKCTERNASSIKDLDAHLQGEQSAADRIAKRQDGLQDVTTSENPDDRSTSGQIGGDEKSSVVGAPGGVDDDKAPVTLPVSNECPNPGTTCENGGSKHSVDQISNNEALAENTSYPHTASVSTGAGNDMCHFFLMNSDYKFYCSKLSGSLN